MNTRRSESLMQVMKANVLCWKTYNLSCKAREYPRPERTVRLFSKQYIQWTCSTEERHHRCIFLLQVASLGRGFGRLFNGKWALPVVPISNENGNILKNVLKLLLPFSAQMTNHAVVRMSRKHLLKFEKKFASTLRIVT